MSQKFAQSLKLNRGYVPSQPVAGEANDTVYAGENVIFKGSPQNVHAEVYRGNHRVTNPEGATLVIPGALTHAASLIFTEGSDQFSRDTTIPPPGTGPLPRPGWTILVDNKLYLVTQIINHNEAKLTPAFEGPSGGYLAYVVPTLCAMNDILGVCYGAGNAVSLPQGHVLVTGVQQRLVLVGSPAPTGKAQLLLNVTIPAEPSIIRQLNYVYQPARPLGFAKPPVPVLAAVSSGTKNMPAGRYSIRLVRASLETAGYGNPSEATEIQITAGQRIEVTFPLADANQTSWRVFCSLYSVAEGITGPWYEIEEVTEAVVAGGTGRKKIYEWRDYEIAGSQLVTFDNNIPPAAAFIAVFGGSPVLISTQGTPDIGGFPTAPGPSVQPGKAYNAEGYPPGASLAMGPVQDIVSFVEGEGRLYVATHNYVHILTLTGNPDQPLTVRPFVQSSIIRHSALVYVEGVLYGYSARGPVRVSGEGTGMEDRVFAAPVRATTEHWKAGRVFTVYDPHNEALLWVHSNDSQNASGFWRTMVLSYSLTLGIWSTPLWVESESLNMTITGVATLNGRAFLITSDGLLLMWDAPNETKNWFMMTPYIDQPGVAGAKKNIRHLTVTHRGASTSCEIYGIEAAGSESTASMSGSIGLPAVAESVSTTAVSKLNVRNMRLYAIKLMGTSHLGDVHANRVDEIIIDGNVHGPVT